MIKIGPVTAEILLSKSLCGGWVVVVVVEVGDGWWVVCKPILVFSLSLGQAEQYAMMISNLFFVKTNVCVLAFKQSKSFSL